MSLSLSESALKKLSTDEITALALECKNKFDSTLTNINKEISDLSQIYGKRSQNFAPPDKSDKY